MRVGWNALSRRRKALGATKNLPLGRLEEQVSQSPASQHQQQSYCADQVNNSCVSEHANQSRGGPLLFFINQLQRSEHTSTEIIVMVDVLFTATGHRGRHLLLLSSTTTTQYAIIMPLFSSLGLVPMRSHSSVIIVTSNQQPRSDPISFIFPIFHISHFITTLLLTLVGSLYNEFPPQGIQG